jgi:hypothetical protein
MEHNRTNPPPPRRTEDATLVELRAIRKILDGFTQRFDEFARVYLDAKFPYGKPWDRWGRRG